MATASHRSAPRAPRLPDRYVPIRRIAAGGTATVWCAEDRLLGRRVAIKLLAQPYASDHEAVRRFTREARAAAHLSSHPHVVTIYDVGETAPELGPGHGAQPFIVMEYLSGGTVADALRVRAVTPDDSVRWLHEAAQAIDFAHAKGVLHRDIKPANLLLDGDRTLHVADFGIAQLGWEDTLASTGHVLGTASYLPPERVLGRPATVASDLYALAVTAFELLTGELPFRADSYLVQARMHLEQEPPAPSARNPQLPGRLDPILARGLAKDPDARWPSAEAFATAIGEALAPAAEALEAPTAPLDPRAAAVSRARRALAGPVTSAARTRSAGTRSARTRSARTRPARTQATPGATARRRDPRPRRRPPRGLLAGAAVVLTLAVLGFAWAQTLGAPGAHPARSVRIARSQVARRGPRQQQAPTHRSAAKAPARPGTSTVQAVPAAAPSPAASADALEARGHALLEAGQYARAIPVLRKAVATASPQSLTYAYALFDLGRALLLSGDPSDAARVLVRRLAIPNQTGVVRHELELALRALAASGGAAVDSPPDHKHPRGPGPVPPGPDSGN